MSGLMGGYVGGLIWGLAAGLLIAVAALFGVWWERKVAGRIQMRFGPQTTGPFGILQTLADTLKLILKEDITPRLADKRLFRIAPFLVFAPIALSLVVIPYGPGFAPLDTSVGMLFFLAVPGMAVIGILVAGWSSRNTYATIGGLRGAAQMISYELPRSLSVLALVMLAGSMRPLDVMAQWRIWWILPLNLVGFLVYFIASIAEVNRGPFDIPEAESELVAGYFADYSGIRWAIFMMSEYGGVVAASLFGAAFFLGGWTVLPGVFGVLLFVLETLLIITAMIWVKWTFPRMRSDQLMNTAWKVLTPMALVQVLVVGVVIAWL
ncbi:MAG: NADH-quinone oxidoreductase subunit NuoH [Coriobacteriia bacterium]|nr:NADH-quinone oxidoreductase subunit NuoH [Coriobacteriia bacterium]